MEMKPITIRLLFFNKASQDGAEQKMGRIIENAVNKTVAVLGSVAFVGMVLSTTLNVLSRYLFSVSFAWAEEVAYLFFNWAVFLGVTLIYKNMGLISIDILVTRFPEKIQKMVAIFNFVLLSLICGALTVWGLNHAIRGWVRKTPAIEIRYSFLNMAIPVAAVIMLAYSIKFLVMTLRNEKIAEAAVEERA